VVHPPELLELVLVLEALDVELEVVVEPDAPPALVVELLDVVPLVLPPPPEVPALSETIVPEHAAKPSTTRPRSQRRTGGWLASPVRPSTGPRRHDP
jgi:hypothetical protein